MPTYLDNLIAYDITANKANKTSPSTTPPQEFEVLVAETWNPTVSAILDLKNYFTGAPTDRTLAEWVNGTLGGDNTRIYEGSTELIISDESLLFKSLGTLRFAAYADGTFYPDSLNGGGNASDYSNSVYGALLVPEPQVSVETLVVPSIPAGSTVEVTVTLTGITEVPDGMVFAFFNSAESDADIIAGLADDVVSIVNSGTPLRGGLAYPPSNATIYLQAGNAGGAARWQGSDENERTGVSTALLAGYTAAQNSVADTFIGWNTVDGGVLGIPENVEILKATYTKSVNSVQVTLTMHNNSVTASTSVTVKIAGYWAISQ